MSARVLRVALLTFLAVVVLVASRFLYDIDQRAREVQAVEDALDARLARMSDVLAGIGAAQQSYVAPGQQEEPWFERMSALVQQLYDEQAAAGVLLRSAEAAVALDAMTASTEALLAADTRARENLRLSQPLMAADVIFSDGRNTLEGMQARVHELRASETASYRAEQAALSRERWTVLGAGAALWMLGALGLAAVPRRGRADTPPGAAADGPSNAATPDEAAPRSDLAATAALCTDLSRVTTTEALAELLGRAATVLDASGVIVWMSAGEELFAVTAHGYGPEMIARLGPLSRDDDNATVTAWRTGQVATVASDGDGSGAVVAPMFGPHTCIGVLAFEVRGGAERDPATRALAAIVAAQLATAVSAWPAASAAQSPDAPAERTRHVARDLARDFRSAGGL